MERFDLSGQTASVSGGGQASTLAQVQKNDTLRAGIRFDNPMFSLTTTFNREDFTRLLIEKFAVPAESVQAFFDTARGMNFYDDQNTTVGELFEKFFPESNLIADMDYDIALFAWVGTPFPSSNKALYTSDDPTR